MHTLTTTNQRFVSIGLFKDRNFVTGNVLMFAMGLILFATLSLMPPMLQELLSYPVVTAGLIMTPRGLVSMVSLLLVGRIIDKVDTRFVIVTGFVLTAISAWQMTGFNLQMDAATVVQSSIAQGFASGFVFVPATVATFSTLAATLRDEGAAILNLTRNIGASVGVSAAQTLLTRNTQIEHAVLAQHVNPFSAASRAHLGASPSPQAMAALNEVVNRQAIMLAYNDNFKLLLITCLAVIPLVFLLRKTSKAAAAAVLID
jgi:DHA2 family multidrug resistance protein